ncbi:MAG: Gfo/Idh/MocA family oxidoreductase [Armatimonadetes bacterium]|nr:Gfo/Idh/MocA family oxidoreductase [Armatimonadota bacterium]
MERRAFLGAMAVAGMARGLRAAPSERLNVGFLGTGNIAGSHLGPMLGQPDTQVVAVCDPRPERRRAFAANVNQHYGTKDCREYADFRELLARPDIDCVLICTPDNWHALMTIAAARAGKHMYSEKPFALTIHEGRAMVQAVERHGVVFQHGTQQRSDPRFRQACELARNGRLGRIHTVRVAVAGGRQGSMGTLGPVPDGFDYDMWLGPAPVRPYSPERVDTSHWYFISDYSAGGYLSGWGIHHVDIAQWGLGTELTGPVKVAGTAVMPQGGLCDTPITWRVEYEFATGTKVIFTDAGQQREGCTFEGDKGSVWVTRGAISADPPSLLREVIGPDETQLYRSAEHHRNWLDCIKTGATTVAPAEVGHRSQTICSLSDIAVRLGRTIRWDAKAERVIDDETANRMLTRALRAPWTL